MLCLSSTFTLSRTDSSSPHRFLTLAHKSDDVFFVCCCLVGWCCLSCFLRWWYAESCRVVLDFLWSIRCCVRIVVSVVLAQCPVCAGCMLCLHMVGVFVCQRTTLCIFQLVILFTTWLSVCHCTVCVSLMWLTVSSTSWGCLLLWKWYSLHIHIVSELNCCLTMRRHRLALHDFASIHFT
jgi:hypothetical protein